MVTIKEGDIVVSYKRFGALPSDLKRCPNMYLYKIIGIAPNCSLDSEDTTMVIYQSLYHKNPQLFVRDIGDFFAFIFDAGRYRFEKWEGEVV